VKAAAILLEHVVDHLDDGVALRHPGHSGSPSTGGDDLQRLGDVFPHLTIRADPQQLQVAGASTTTRSQVECRQVRFVIEVPDAATARALGSVQQGIVAQIAWRPDAALAPDGIIPRPL
jgi:hypothetical protein